MQPIIIKVIFLSLGSCSYYSLFDWLFILNHFNPNLNNSKTNCPLADVNLDVICSVGGKFKNKKLSGAMLNIIFTFK